MGLADLTPSSIKTLQVALSRRPVQYSGHGKGTGGLQQHSIGDEYPYMIEGVGHPTRWRAMDTRNSQRGVLRLTYKEAEADLYSLKLRNMMHG